MNVTESSGKARANPVGGRGPLVGAAVALAFLLLYFSEVLYSSGPTPDTRLARWQILLWSVGVLPLDAPSPLQTLFENLANPGELVGRLPLALLAGSVWIVAGVTGSLIVGPFLPKRALTRSERRLIEVGLGMALLAVTIQLLGLAGFLSRAVLMGLAGVIVAVWIVRQRRGTDRDLPLPTSMGSAGWGLPTFAILTSAAILGLALLAAMLPTPDYDAHAYHLLAPKEWYLAGRVTFLPGNVYASFPFLTEMFTLASMHLMEESFLGGLLGQTILFGFGVATSIGVGLLAARWFGAEAGWFAFLIYATSPWTYRLSSIPYVEGALLFYLVLGLLVVSRTGESFPLGAHVAGLTAGAAFGCKYTALPFVVSFLAIGALIQGRRQPVRTLFLFVLGFALMGSVWLVRNYFWTGNPVYPLLYSWFGGADWSPELADKFARGHQSTQFGVASAASYLRDIVSRGDWQTGLAFAFLPLAWFAGCRRRYLLLIAMMVTTFLLFYVSTHRLDRFFLTLQPIAAVLGGAGWSVLARSPLRAIGMVAVVVCVWFNFILCTTPLVGLNLYTAPLAEVRRVSLESVAPSLALLNDAPMVHDDETVLYVGLAAVYDSRPKAIYSTVFNENALENLIADDEGTGLRPADEVRRRLAERNIDYIFVDHSWIDRYRAPGNYGFTPFVTPALFDTLVAEGIIQPVTLPTRERTTAQLFRVVKEETPQ